MRFKNWILILLAAMCGFSVPALAVNITISCGAVGQERDFCEQAVNAWARKTGNTVTVLSPPDETNQRYFKYLIDLNNEDSGVDIYQIDVIWPGLLAHHFVDLKEYIQEDQIQKHHPAIIKNNTVQGKLVGMPWFTDVGLLYYRSDLLEKYDLEVPSTWSELEDMALFIQTQERQTEERKQRLEIDPFDQFWGFVFQGNNYEGLTCNALEWVSSYNGGTFIDDNGNITANNSRAALAIAQAASCVNTISPDRVTYFIERDALLTFQRDNAVFMRNWPYAWAILNGPESPVAGKVEVAPLPKGGVMGNSASTLGGWQLAVSKYSKHPEVAADLVGYLTSEEVQKQRAVEGSLAPTIMSLYEDPDVMQANPFFDQLPGILVHAVARPAGITGSTYMAASTHIWEAVHDVLQGNISAVNSLSRLQDQLQLVKVRGGW